MSEKQYALAMVAWLVGGMVAAGAMAALNLAADVGDAGNVLVLCAWLAWMIAWPIGILRTDR